MSKEIVKTVAKAAKTPRVAKVKVEKVAKDSTPHTRSDNEAINLAKIHNHLNTGTSCGDKIRQAFATEFPNTPQFTSSVISPVSEVPRSISPN